MGSVKGKMKLIIPRVRGQITDLSFFSGISSYNIFLLETFKN